MKKLLSLLNTVITSFNALLPNMKWVVALLLTLLLWSVVHDIGSRNDFTAQLDALKAHAAQAAVTVKTVDSLTGVVTHLKHTADSLTAQASAKAQETETLRRNTTAIRDSVSTATALLASAQTTRDSLLAAVTLIPLQRQALDSDEKLIAIQQTQITELVAANSAKDSVIQLLEFSRDTLIQTINTTPRSITNPEKLFGFLPLPSRKTSLVTGLVGGVILALKLAGTGR